MSNQHFSRWISYTSDRESGYERMKVDSAQTGFFEGREFRSFLELSLTGGQTAVMRFTCPVSFILFEQTLALNEGEMRVEAVAADGTPGGTWASLPVIGKNRMPERRQPYYVAQAALATGGTHTGGTVVEVIQAKTDSNTNRNSTVGARMSDERGLPAGTYYIRFTAIGAAARGIYSLWWEERPALFAPA